jgi:carbon starvation protein
MILVLSDGTGAGGLKLWPLFGSTNQLLGSLTLLVISVWLFKSRGKFLITLVPMIFITIITFIATYFNIVAYINDKNYLLLSIAFVIGVSQLWILFEGIKAFRTTEPDGHEL